MNPLKQLESAGQSPWLDYVSRDLVTSGEIATLIARDGLKGMTSNPTIFEKSITSSPLYDAAIRALLAKGDQTPTALYEHLAIEDIQAAADALLPVYKATKAVDGYISLEVSPYLAHDTAATIAEARSLWARVNRPNLMVKVPATPEGIPAIRELIAAGINVNVTLLFALDAYKAVAEAYLEGLEHRASLGNPVDHIASVASFFVSRIDAALDPVLDKSLQGKIAIANAQLAYAWFEELTAGSRWNALAGKGAHPQRLLWASTSSKNHAYPDTIYVDRLVGADTVNTIPPATMDAFRDHGTAEKDAIKQNIAQAPALLQQLEDHGISLPAITDRLLTDGVKQFADAFDRLLGAVAHKRALILNGPTNQLIHPGPLGAILDKTIEQWRAAGDIRRLWAKDATLWTGTAESHWLGWLDTVDNELDQPGKWRDLRDDVRERGITDIVLLGMGGSSLGPEVLNHTFAGRVGPRFHMLDSTDPASVAAVEAEITDYPRTLFIVSSKSGSTLEPNIFLAYFHAKVLTELGPDDAGQNFIAITDPGSSLEKQARQLRFWHIFYGEPAIGGRYSVLSAFGLAPAAALGIDVPKFLALTRQTVIGSGKDVPPAENDAVKLGLAWGLAAKSGRDKLTIIATPSLASLGAWIEQLVAESTGKNGQAIIPIDGEPLSEAGRYGQDRFFLFYRLGAEKDLGQEKVKAELIALGHPVAEITVKDAYHLGQEFFRLEIATAVAGSLLGINPFDQPDVEASKLKTRALTDAYEQTGKLPAETPVFTAPGISIFADAPNAAAIAGATTLEELLAAHLNRAHPGDYVALLAYIHRIQPHTDRLNSLRAALLRARGLASALGFGPRFLHSTGQAYKGGSNNGVFIQITVADQLRLPIPGRKFTFAVVKAAQAQGDLAVLYDRNRRAIRVHLDNLLALDRFIKAAEIAIFEGKK